MGINGYPHLRQRHQEHHHEIPKLIAEIEEFKGRWKVMESLAPEKLTSLRWIATIETVGRP
jgi:hypothetical protein